MKKLLIVAALISLLLAVTSFAADGKKYGKEITIKDMTKISEILEKPENFLGKKVLISGLVVGVCEMRGCWIDIASDKPYEKIKVKVDDGVIVFPLTAKGHNALVEGEVTALKVTKEQALKIREYEAQKHGKEFDPSTVTSGETIYQIQGLGAVIKE